MTQMQKLFIVADRYQINRLKALCEENLFQRTSVENSIKMLILADKHNGQQLRAACFEYIVNHIDKIKGTNDFKTMKLTHPQLGCEILTKLVDKE